MSVRQIRILSMLSSALLIVGLIGGLVAAPVASAQTGGPSYLRMVERLAGQTWDVKPGSLKTGTISAVVYIDGIEPLALAANRNWTHAQRVAHVAKIRAAQDRLIPQIEGLGGKIRGRLTHLAAGLAVTIDVSRTDDLRALGGVIAVSSVGNYQLDLSETAGFIGARALESLGVTGAGVDVAVIDSGVDYTHVKLGGPGTVAAYNEAYCGDAGTAADPLDPACTAFDLPDATGFFGDPQYGRDGSPVNKVVGGYDWVGELWPTFGPATSDANPIDLEGHGTHVSDIIGGLESAPGAGDAGVAPGANIWGFKACSAVSSSCEGLALLLAVDDAMDLDDSDYEACEPGVDPYCLTYDPADVINMSLGSPYGQPEDDLSLFSDIASYYGSLVVVSAGNSGDRPYIVGSPSTASAALSVAQTTVPSDKFFNVTVGSSVTAKAVIQPWGPAVAGTLSGALQYGDGAGGNLNGCAAFAPGSLTGRVLLVDRGGCNVSIKGANGSAGGAAFVLIANNSFSNTPPSFSYGGGVISVPTLTVTQNEGTALKALAGQTASIAETSIVALPDDIVASSGRGPRIADGAIKPDIAAPGASVSAEVGTGNGQTAFGGTSGAAPMVSGAAALIIEAYEDRGLLDSDPGLEGPFFSLAPVIKSVLMNNANTRTYIGGSAANGGSGFLAPITLQGAGRVDALKAFNAETIAWDVTEFDNWLSTGVNPPCEVTPVLDVAFFSFLGIPPDCADDFPFGNDAFNAWNKQTGSLSFGYDGYSANASETRKVLISNLSNTSRTYNLSSSYRYSDDVGKGAVVSFSPSSVTIPAGGSALVDVKMTVTPQRLRNWSLNAGEFGNAGTNIFCSDPNPQSGCPTLTIFEIDGFVKINGGTNNTVMLPWQILPKKAANTYVRDFNSNRVRFSNPAKWKAGDTDVFSLIEVSPNNCEVVDENDECLEPDYVPGILPGVNATAIDIKEVGVRSYQVPGLNASLGLPAATGGAVNDEVVEFAVSVYDAPFRASHNYPVEFDIYVDSNSDGVRDYVIFNADLNLNASDGRNAVFVADVNPADGTRPQQPYFFSNTDFNSQNWMLPVPAAAIGLRSNQPFKFYVLAFDAYFTGDLWDCAPLNCGTYHTYQTGKPKYQPVTSSFQVKAQGNYTLTYSKPSGGAAASPSQTGLLFFYRDALVGNESDAVTLP